MWAWELVLDIPGRRALGGAWCEARKVLDGEAVTALQKPHSALPQCSVYLAGTGPSDVSAPNPRDCWVNMNTELRPLGGGGPNVPMAPFFTGCLLGEGSNLGGGLDRHELWVCGREQPMFPDSIFGMASSVLRPREELL